METKILPRKIINPVIGDVVTFINTSKETGGQFCEFDVELLAGGGNILHYHKNFSETFTALEGEVGVIKNGKKIILQPGESTTVYPGEVHRFFNPTEGRVKFKGIIEPGNTLFEDGLRIVYGLARDRQTNEDSVPKNPLALAVILKTSDINLPKDTALGKLGPLITVLYKLARYSGVEKRLYEKYCQN